LGNGSPQAACGNLALSKGFVGDGDTLGLVVGDGLGVTVEMGLIVTVSLISGLGVFAILLFTLGNL